MKHKDLTGLKVGSLTVLCLDHKEPIYKNNNKVGYYYFYKCKCDCGKEAVILSFCLTRKNATISCGCRRGQPIKHNLTKSRLYYIWRGIKSRCFNPNNSQYPNYGYRGISVCDEWLADFMNFYNWAMANGYDFDAPRGQCTIDRIDVNGNYEPSNCRWITNKEQQRNRRDNNTVTYNGITHCLSEWAEIFNTSYYCLKHMQERNTLKSYFAKQMEKLKMWGCTV